MCVGGQGSPACNVRIACCSADLSCDVVNLLPSASSVFAKAIKGSDGAASKELSRKGV